MIYYPLNPKFVQDCFSGISAKIILFYVFNKLHFGPKFLKMTENSETRKRNKNHSNHAIQAPADSAGRRHRFPLLFPQGKTGERERERERERDGVGIDVSEEFAVIRLIARSSVVIAVAAMLKAVESGYIGCNTGNGVKQSLSQACCLA